MTESTEAVEAAMRRARMEDDIRRVLNYLRTGDENWLCSRTLCPEISARIRALLPYTLP